MFLTLLGAYGISAPPGEFTSKSLNEVLKQLEGHPEQRALNQLALRSMMQAVYSSRNMGHYGLGAEDYLHFTSPIRRYPDLLVHRLLKELWGRGKKRPSDEQLAQEEESLEALAVQCSERERAAMQVEREVNQLYSCLLLKDRVGEVHPGVVCGLSENGFFVQLDELWVEGFVRGESVYPDFEFDQSTYRLTFGNGLVVKVGNPCRVQILSVNLERKQIDYQVLELEGAELEAREYDASRPPSRGGAKSSKGERGQRPRDVMEVVGERFGGPKAGGRLGGGGRATAKNDGARSGEDRGRSRGDRPYRSQDRGGRFGGGRDAPSEQPGRSKSARTGPVAEGAELGSTRRFKSAAAAEGPARRFEGARPQREGRRREPPPPQAWEKMMVERRGRGAQAEGGR